MSDHTSPASPSQTSPLNQSDLRHMTSAGVLAHSQHGAAKDHHHSPRAAGNHSHAPRSVTVTRVGSHSPASIPSSPTSVHSSSSAIFERDIEPIVCPSPPHTSAHPPNVHRMPRSKTTEQLEHSVPSVLDSAAAILTASLSPSDDVSVVAPCLDVGRRSGFTSPIGSLRSRSPSPLGNGPSAAMVKSLLLGIPSPSSPQQTQAVGATAAPSTSTASPPITRPIVHANIPTSGSVTPPAIVTPTSYYYSTTSSVASSPKTTTLEHFPGTLPSAPPPHPTSISTSTSAPTNNTSPISNALLNPSHPPSPTHSATKRLSFMSYSDLLSSTPASLVPLSSFTAPTTSDPPPHIPIVSGLAQAGLPPRSAASAAAAAPLAFGGAGAGAALFSGGALGGAAGCRDSVMLDEVGGEWEREGFGTGLEERLEGAFTSMAAPQAPHQPGPDL